MATSQFLDNFPFLPLPFSSKNFQTPLFPSILKKLNPAPFMKGEGGSSSGYLAIIVLHSKNNSTRFINGRGQSCNIFALNDLVNPISSCFKCFINGITLKHLSMYTQNCSGSRLLPQVYSPPVSENCDIKNCDFWFQKLFYL